VPQFYRGNLGRACFALALAGLVSGTLAVAPARAQIDKDQAAANIARDFDVEILRVRPGEIDGTQVWFVTVIRPGGNYNTAFQVTTLAVDQASGELVPAFRHGPNGAVGTASPVDTRIDRRPDSSRSGTWR
jgi:hypothetical protein